MMYEGNIHFLFDLVMLTEEHLEVGMWDMTKWTLCVLNVHVVSE
jgi:hypothetical protein